MSHSTTPYSAQLAEKAELTRNEFSPFFTGELTVYPSPPQHYRMRAEFRLWHEGEDLNYVMFNQETKERYNVQEFPTASRLINKAMPLLLAHLTSTPLLRTKLFQVDFLSSQSEQLVISLLYHKPLTEEWQDALHTLQHTLAAQGLTAHFIGRARKMKYVLGHDYVIEELTVSGRTYRLKQVENSFTQPNAKIAESMLEWVTAHTADSTGDLLELYCGNGNFSIALAHNFRQVLATELAKSSVYAAQWNITENNIPNLKILRLSAEEFAQAQRGEREFKRLKQAQVTLTDYDFHTVLVDPPRAGIDTDALKALQHYPRIIYISCNPHTLRENLETLQTTHTVTHMAFFDQFPYTHHRELGVILEQRKL